jgi:DNA polymerase III epsilon subunit-like protein
MNDQLLRFDKNQRYLVLDTETEGLNLVKSRPYQVSWIIAQGDRVLEKNDRYLWWSDLQMSEGAVRTNKFKYDYYKSRAEDPKSVWEDFSKELYNPEYKVVGQNLLGFDVYMINVWRKLMGLGSDHSYVDRIIDTLSLARAIAKEDEPNFDNFMCWQYGWNNFFQRGLRAGQATLLKKYNIPHDKDRLHDALYDIEMNFKIFRKQLYDIEL